MRVLVTGGSGFIGGHIVQELERRHYDVDIFDIVPPCYYTNADYIKGDVAEEIALSASCYCAVFHCAGLLGTETLFEKIELTERVNVLGTLGVLKWACYDHNTTDGITVIQPNLLGNWLNPYMQSKQQAERYGLMYDREFGLKYLSIRPVDVYGPRQSWRDKKAAPIFIIKALRNEPIPIYGDGMSWVNYIYVEDVAKFMVDAYEAGIHGIVVPISVPDGDMGILEFAKKVIEISGSGSKISHLPMRRGQPEVVNRIEHSCEQAEQIFDLSTLTKLEDGLSKTIAWYRGII